LWAPCPILGSLHTFYFEPIFQFLLWVWFDCFVRYFYSILVCPYKVSQLLHARFDSFSFVFFMWFNGIYICCSVPDIWHHWLFIFFYNRSRVPFVTDEFDHGSCVRFYYDSMVKIMIIFVIITYLLCSSFILCTYM
jgi:hypothetical protein